MIPPQRAIRKLFNDKLILLSDLPTIINENDLGFLQKDDENSPLTEKYMRTSIIPLETNDSSIGIGGCDQFNGLYNVEIFTPTGNGAEESDYWIDEIITQFPKDVLLTDGLTHVHVTQYTAQAGQSFTGYYKCGILIQYTTFMKR